MKKSILLVGVIFLSSFMTLTTTAFGHGKSVCYVEKKKIESGEMNDDYILYELRTQVGMINLHGEYDVIMSSINSVDAVMAAMAFEKTGKCIIVDDVDDSKPICYIEGIRNSIVIGADDSATYHLFKTNGRGDIEFLGGGEDRAGLVQVAINKQKSGECIYSASSSE